MKIKFSTVLNSVYGKSLRTVDPCDKKKQIDLTLGGASVDALLAVMEEDQKERQLGRRSRWHDQD